MDYFSREGRMYTITVFATIEPDELANQLSTVRFKVNQKDGGVYWKGENSFFNIIPFKNQTAQFAKGYRIYTNYPISTVSYLLEGAFNWVDYKVSGIEYQHPFSKPKKEMVKDFLSQPILNTIDARGLFHYENMNIVLMDEKAVFQRRGKIKNLVSELQKIEEVRDILYPADFNLFSLLDNENVG